MFNIDKIKTCWEEVPQTFTKQLEQLKQLEKMASCIIQCFIFNKRGAQMEKSSLIETVQRSYSGGYFQKTIAEVSTLFDLFLEIVPDYFTVTIYNGTTYLRRNDTQHNIECVSKHTLNMHEHCVR